MTDSEGNEIKEGQTLVRIVDGRAVYKGQEYTVTRQKWDGVDSLVADGGFLQELIDPERAKEYAIKKG